MNDPLTHAYAHLLVDMQLAVFAPAFTFSLSESESPRKWYMPCNGTAGAHSLRRQNAQKLKKRL